MRPPMNGRHAPRVHPTEVFIGRTAAIFVHPFAAWRSPSRTDRTLLLISYCAISYLVVFALLRAMSV